jgi:amidase
MDRSTPAAMGVRSGEQFIVETEDCYSGNLRTPKDRFTKEMWPTVNPATGPVAISGARPGRTLRVDILRIRTRAHAVMCVERGAGALAAHIRGVETTIHPIRKGMLHVREGLNVPVRPMIGVIGCAPAGTPVPTGAPGEHGGNMDCKDIRAGTSVYLPVAVPGALLALGDIHAVMGDGECCICGAEVSGEVTARATPLKSALPTPCVETKTHLLFIGSALKLDDCERIVLDKAHRFLTDCEGLGPNDAARFMSLLGDLGVCQVVDPLKTMKFAVPKSALRKWRATP